MKHLKIIGLALVAAAAFMAFAGNASAAPTLTSPSGTEYTGPITATAVETLTLKAGFATDTCTTSTVGGTVSSNTEAEASGSISTLDFGGPCTLTTTTLSTGSLTILPGGEVKAIGSEVTVAALGTSCVYGGGPSPGTKLGTLTGGTTATLSVKAGLPKISGGFACASPAEWTGKYSVTTPDTLLLK